MKAKTFALSFFIIGLAMLSFNSIFKMIGFSVSNDSVIGFSFYLIGALTMFIGGFLIALQRSSDFRYTKHANEKYIEKRGWTGKMIRDTIASADASSLKLSRDTQSPYDLAIVYSLSNDPDNFVVRSVDGRLLQVNDRNRDFKEPSFGSDYLYQGVVEKRKTKISGKAGHKKR